MSKCEYCNGIGGNGGDDVCPECAGSGELSGLPDLLERLIARADNAYIDYINKCRREECLGWEVKVDRGKFGFKELQAHKDAAEQLGKHRALHEAVKMLKEAL